MSNLEALFPHCIQPSQVIDSVVKRTDVEEIIVVVKTTEGKFATYGSGDLSYLAEAALLLTRLASTFVNEKQEDMEE